MSGNPGLAAAQSADNSTAEGLPDKDFIFEGEDGQLVGAGDDFGSDGQTDTPTDEQIADGTEPQTQEGLEAPGAEVGGGQAPAGTQAKAPQGAPAGNQPPQPAPATQPQAPASGTEAHQPAPAFHDIVRNNWDKAVNHVVASGAFRLSKEAAEVIDPAAAPVIENMAAQVYLRTVTTVSEMLHNTLPQVVRNLQGIGTEEQRAEEHFLSTYGFQQGHKQQLGQISVFVRQQNPNLYGKEYMDEVARVAYAYLKVAPPKSAGQQQPNGAGLPQGAKVTNAQRKPFAPAARAGAGQPAVRRAPGSPPAKVDPLADLSAMLAGVDLDD